jgi:3-oxoacyl-[acyl-carrier protein] reductase
MRNVVVTGASRGIGLGIGRRLAAGGYRVIGIARKPSNAFTSAAENAVHAAQGELHFMALDLGELGAIPRLVQGMRKQFGPIYGLINNAGLGTPGALALMPQSQIEQLIRVNTLAPIVLTKFVLRSMLSERAGRIVNIASVAGFTGYRGLSVYAATKASLLGFTRSLAREVGGHGINVNAIAPGFLDTELTQSLGEEQRAQVARRSALGRLPEVGDIAQAVEFLLGDGGNNITGTVLTVDAGATA